MRLERKAVEKLVTDGEEKDELHYSVVGSPDYMAVEVIYLFFSFVSFVVVCRCCGGRDTPP
jgi:hypothetical protein